MTLPVQAQPQGSGQVVTVEGKEMVCYGHAEQADLIAALASCQSWKAAFEKCNAVVAHKDKPGWPVVVAGILVGFAAGAVTLAFVK
jgi:hypothetical protein